MTTAKPPITKSQFVKQMNKLCGTNDPNQWGGWITLVITNEKIGGEPTDCIRIAPKRPAPKVKVGQ